MSELTLTKRGNPRKRRSGAGAPSRLNEPVRTEFYLEAADRAALDALGGDRAEHIRQAIKHYLAAQEQK